ncbi:alpha-hydroxy acid oxidase [Lapillicoccus jejuensis]|uniref:4-hydroxymandelate oxidase n=1 Tax=Lapillicoccus jejuensis TaxID=402171 RepID=A0A542E421_9MICO|nr:alpha-hydroxy acid oxidase [Lapillicoccus jejuensis]TQJ10092.1 4-hydroxymandelate oxidase [Lapillicoccus jejuensis]
MLPLLQDVRRRAHQVVPAPALDYLETGSGQEVTLGEAEQAWRDWRLVPQILAGVGPLSSISTATRVLGDVVATPVLAAPTAYHRFVHDEGELATARGVAAAGSLMVLSSRVTVPLEDVADALRAGGTPWWWQSYLVGERAVTAGLAERAVAAGATAIVLTGDTPYVSVRTRTASGPVPVDEEVLAVNMARHVPRGADLSTALAQAPANLADIRWLHELTGLPVLVKGVLGGEDAQRCLEAGAAGVVVSTHGGRQLDRVVASAHVLPDVVEAVGGAAPVLVDGGIRTGIDVLVALALGADAVLLGRPVVWGLAAGGAQGVGDVLGAVTADLAHGMGLLGAADVAGVRAARHRVVPAGLRR